MKNRPAGLQKGARTEPTDGKPIVRTLVIGSTIGEIIHRCWLTCSQILHKGPENPATNPSAAR